MLKKPIIIVLTIVGFSVFFITQCNGQGVYIGSIQDTLHLGCCEGCAGAFTDKKVQIPTTFHFYTHKVFLTFEFEGREYTENAEIVKYREKCELDYYQEDCKCYENFHMEDFSSQSVQSDGFYMTKVFGDANICFQAKNFSFYFDFYLKSKKPMCIRA